MPFILEATIVQVLIKHQFTSLNGLVSTEQQLAKPLPDVKKAIQIIHVRDSHWALISTLNCPIGKVKLYDSLYNSISTDTAFVIAQLIRGSTKTIKVNNYNECSQASWFTRLCSFCCGIFNINCQWSRSNNRVYEQDGMRPHLVNCFERGIMQTFPTIKARRPAKSVVKSNTIDIYCTCRLPYNGERMVICEKCNNWYHVSCLPEDQQKGITDDEKEWLCKNCK